ncbi:MAG: TonB-dependent receptor [Bryobacterales bacterium]|nr:TonB-dependent receptor [Bryobacterales bacterium]
MAASAIDAQVGSPGEFGAPSDALFQDLPIVHAAALHAQTLEEAPANVTIITAADIRRYGYRTLGEALASVRGFYGTNDRAYQYFGSRGVNLPGDYNTRFLVMLNGQPLTEAIYASNNFFGADFGLDLDLIERIEVIRGPTGALYGSNGMLANINVVTKSPVGIEHGRLSTETDSFGQRKVTASTSVDLGRGRNLLVSASVFNNRGQSLYVPEYNTPSTGFGYSSTKSDRERGYHSFANLLIGQWNLMACFNSRQKYLPIGWAETGIFDSQDSWAMDERNMLGAMYSREVRRGGKIRWQIFWDQYRYTAQEHYRAEEDLEPVYAESNRAQWVNTRLTYDFSNKRLGNIMIGAFSAFELQNRQHGQTRTLDSVEDFFVDAADRQQAVFAQVERKLARRLTAHAGLRFDNSFNYGVALSPRLALVFQQSNRTAWKIVYGRPFRNPSAYEKYWNDGVALSAALNLQKETAHTLEGVLERKLKRGLLAVANVYDYRLNKLIQTNYEGGLAHYDNANAIKSRGVELELGGPVSDRLRMEASVALQRASERQVGWLVNSPRWIVNTRTSYDLVPKRVTLAGAFYTMGRRLTFLGDEVPRVHMLDVTVSTVRLSPRFDIVAGVRNLLDGNYVHPAALAIDRMPFERRSVFVKLIARSGE